MAYRLSFPPSLPSWSTITDFYCPSLYHLLPSIRSSIKTTFFFLMSDLMVNLHRWRTDDPCSSHIRVYYPFRPLPRCFDTRKVCYPTKHITLLTIFTADSNFKNKNKKTDQLTVDGISRIVLPSLPCPNCDAQNHFLSLTWPSDDGMITCIDDALMIHTWSTVHCPYLCLLPSMVQVCTPPDM